MAKAKSNYVQLEHQEVDFAAMCVPEKGTCNYKLDRVPENKIDGKMWFSRLCDLAVVLIINCYSWQLLNDLWRSLCLSDVKDIFGMEESCLSLRSEQV